MELVLLEPEDIKLVSNLTQKKNVVKYVGNGNIWSQDKLENFIKYNKEEQKNIKPRQRYYKIVENNKFVGIIGFFLLIFYGGYYMNAIISPEYQGMGYFHKSLNLLKEKIKSIELKSSRIYILVNKEDERMLSIANKHYYYNRNRNMKNFNFKEYAIFLRDYTYYFGLKSKEENEIAGKILEKRANWRPYNPIKDKNKNNVDFMYLYLDSKFDKKLFSLKSLLKNLTIKRGVKILNKNLLFEELEKLPSAKKYLVENYYVNLKNMNMNKIKNMFQKYGILIFKPVHGYVGIGIEVFDNFDNFKNYISSLKFKNSLDQIKKEIPNIDYNKFNEWVLQEYIDNPMLTDGKKFHVRGYLLVHQDKKYLLKKGEMFIAKKKYKLEEYQDKDIHDTHHSTNPNYVKYYPEDLRVNKKIEQDIENQMIDLFRLVGSIDKFFNCYSESKDCYQVFGFDVMITNDYQVKIIEINENPRLPSLKVSFGREILENEIKLMVDPVFPPKNKVDEESDFIQVY